MHLGKFRLWALFLAINLFGFALLGIAYMQGLVNLVIERDSSNISLTIFAVFCLGLILCVFRVHRLNGAFDDLANGRGEVITRYRKVAAQDASNATTALQVALTRKLMWIKSIAGFLPALGLLGTVVGLAMSLEADLITAENLAERVQEILPVFLAGLGVAFYTTIVGLIFWLWITVNIELLQHESMRLIENILESSHGDTLKQNGAAGGNQAPAEQGG